MRTRPRRWLLTLALLPLTTCTQLVAPHVGGAIAYVHDPEPGLPTLILLERPGPGAHVRSRQLRFDPVGVRFDRPSWSPDGRHLMLSAIGASGPQLYTMSYPEGQLTQVTSSPKRKLCPSWSPDGTRVVVARDVDINQGSSELVIIDLATKVETPVFATNPGFVLVVCPSWSPDGTKIVFGRGNPNTGEPGEIYVVGVDGMGLTNLTNTPVVFESYPAWSPDGRRIAFSGVGLQIMNADGSGVSTVVATAAECPGWSPSGAALAFLSPVDPNTSSPIELFAVDLRDHDLERLTFTGSGYIWCPAWQP